MSHPSRFPLPISRRRCLHALALPWLAAAAGCGGGAADRQPGTPAPAPTPRPPSFSADGLNGHVVRRLRPAPGGLLAATEDGLFQRGGAGWLSLGLRGQTVHDVTAIAPGRWLASVSTTGQVPRDFRLLETVDGGAQWHEVAHDFGGEDGREGIHALAFDVAAGRVLASGANVLAASTDQGRRWTRLAGEWHAFSQPKEALAFDPVRGDAWFGGQDAIEGLVLHRWRAASGELDSHPGLLPNPSGTKGIRFAIGDPQRVLVSGEGGIVQTRDNGARWQVLLHDDYRFYFDVLQDPQRPQRLVSASWLKEFERPQPLIVAISDDDGAHWRQVQHPDTALFGGPWSMALAIEQGETVYYFGLYKGGVMRMVL